MSEESTKPDIDVQESLPEENLFESDLDVVSQEMQTERNASDEKSEEANLNIEDETQSLLE